MTGTGGRLGRRWSERRGPDATARLDAVRASRSADELTAALDDSSPEVARAAIGALAELDAARAAGELRARLLVADLSLVGDIAGALRRLGDREATAVAIAGLREQPYTRRLAAARALGVLGGPRAAEALRAALGDEIAGVRVAALRALGAIGRHADPDGACARLLSDPDPHVRLSAVQAVARTAAHPGMVIAPAAGDADRLVRLEVARHLAGLPKEPASRLLADGDLRVREAAAEAAGVGQIDQLARMLVEDPAADVRHAAARTLGELLRPSMAGALVPGIEDPDAIVRAAVLRALARALGRAGAIERLCAELSSPRPARRRAAVYALARLEATEAAAAVRGLADDPDAGVRLALLHSAGALLDETEPLARRLAHDPDLTVRHAAELSLSSSASRDRDR